MLRFRKIFRDDVILNYAVASAASASSAFGASGLGAAAAAAAFSASAASTSGAPAFWRGGGFLRVSRHSTLGPRPAACRKRATRSLACAAVLDPMRDAFGHQLHALGVFLLQASDLYVPTFSMKTAIARIAAVGHHDVIKRTLLGP